MDAAWTVLFGRLLLVLSLWAYITSLWSELSKQHTRDGSSISSPRVRRVSRQQQAMDLDPARVSVLTAVQTICYVFDKHGGCESDLFFSGKSCCGAPETGSGGWNSRRRTPHSSAVPHPYIFHGFDKEADVWFQNMGHSAATPFL